MKKLDFIEKWIANVLNVVGLESAFMKESANIVAEWCKRLVLVLMVLVSFFFLCALFSSCTRTVYVPVKDVQTVYQHHTDTVHQTDSIIKEKETVVMQLDSEAMARFGVQISNAEKAWLVREKEFEKRINELLERKSDTVLIRDSIQVPYPVEKPTSTMTKMWINLGKFSAGAGFCAIFLSLIYIVMKKRD